MFYIFAIVPRVRQVQLDRERILRLMLLIPKSNVYDLVHRVYTTADAEQEEDLEDDDVEESASQTEEGEGDVNEAQEITVTFLFQLIQGCC